MSESRVFVVQRQTVRDPETGGFVPKYDLGAAEAYGRLVYLLGPTAKPAHPGLVDDVAAALKEPYTEWFNSQRDYILPIGNPYFIGMVVALAAAMDDGRVRLLQWHGRAQTYRCVPMDLSCYVTEPR